jgi:hypothetical protein
MMPNLTKLIVAAAAAVLLTAGCAAQKPASSASAGATTRPASCGKACCAKPPATADDGDNDNKDPLFRHAGVDTRRVFEAQKDVGAANDATLYARDFDAVGLNGLGRAKVAAIARGHAGSPAPVTVYLDVPADALSAAQRRSVADALDDAGVPAEHARLVDGANPSTERLATMTASKLYKTESNNLGPADALSPGGNGTAGYGGSPGYAGTATAK